MARNTREQRVCPFCMKNCGKYVACHGMGVCKKNNAVIYLLKKVYKWRSTTWWHSLQTRMMKEDPENRARWKHKWRCTIVEMCGIRWPRDGRARKTGWKQQSKIDERRSRSSSLSFCAKLSYPPNTGKPKTKTKRRG